MTSLDFLLPLNGNNSSLIVDVADAKEYTYLEFGNLIDQIVLEIDACSLASYSIVIIYGYRNAFKTMLLFLSCIKADLVPFIVEFGDLHKMKDLKFNAIISDLSKDFIAYKSYDLVHFSLGYLCYNFNKNIYVGSANDMVIVSSSGSTSATPKKVLLGKQQTVFNIQSNKAALNITKLKFPRSESVDLYRK